MLANFPGQSKNDDDDHEGQEKISDECVFAMSDEEKILTIMNS